MHLHCLSIAVLVAALLPAQVNSALQLTGGVHGGVDVPFHAAMSPPCGLTVEAWVTFDDATRPAASAYPTIARQNVATQQENWLLRVATGRSLEFGVRTTAGVFNIVAWTFPPGALAGWTHLAATCDGPTLRIYRNGVQVAIRTLGTDLEMRNNGGVLRIGNGDTSTPGRETWHGQIDELRVWPMPRTAGEIVATMNQALSFLPGKVLTFNLNGSYVDSSTNLLGTAFGTVAFGPGPPITMLGPIGVQGGQSTTSCPRTIDIAIGSLPQLGNSVFAIWCTKAPRSGQSPVGIFVAAGQPAPVNQPPLLGIDLFFAPASVLAQVVFVPRTFGLGLQRHPLPVPNNALFMGTTLFTQFGFFDAQCGPQGISASNGLAVVVQ